MVRTILCCALLVVVMGCSGNDNNAGEEEAKGTVFDSQIKALDKAKEVNEQIQDAAEKQRRAIEEQGG